MNCYDCGEALGADELTYLGTDEGAQPFCDICTDMREFTGFPAPPDVEDDSPGDIFDHYRFPTAP